MKNRHLPFGWIPRNWKLEGKARQREWAKYYYEGEELDYQLLDIEFDNKDSNDYKIEKLKLDEKHKKINSNELDKQIATIHNEPYFRVLKGEYNQTGPDQGTMMFELDWNEAFVKELQSHGWIGLTDDFIVNSWFEDSCKQMLGDDTEEALQPPITAYNRTRKQSSSGNKTEYS